MNISKLNSLLFFLAIVLSSCGTLTKSPSIVRLSSNEPGTLVKVTDDERAQTNVITPALVEIAPGNSFSTEWANTTKKHKSKNENTCSWQWGKSILPNSLSVFAGIPGIAFALFFNSIDYLTGNIFNCDQLVTKNGFKNDKKKKKLRAFIIPPRRNDSKESLQISELYISKELNQKQFTVIRPSESNSALANLGINNINSPKHDEVPYNRLRKYAVKAKVEYAILLNIKEELNGEARELKITPQLINLITQETKILKHYSVQSKAQVNSAWTTLARFINFIPNSLTLSYYNNPRIRGGAVSTNSRRTKVHPKSFPKVVNSLGMSSVVHPQFMRTWDYSFQTYTSLGASAWRSESGKFAADISSFYMLYNAQLTGHFPFGAINMDLGFGAGTFNVEEAGLSRRKYRSMIKAGVSYVAFISHNLFLKGGADQYSIIGTIGSTAASSTFTFYETYFGIGYYFPELRYLVRDLF